MRILLASIALAGFAACRPPRPRYHFVIPTVSAGGAGACDPVADGEATCPRVAVTGQVKRPGLVRYEAGLTIVGAIAACGGMTELASGAPAIVTRVVDGAPHRYPISIRAIFEGDQPDLALRGGDVVYVPEGGI